MNLFALSRLRGGIPRLTQAGSLWFMLTILTLGVWHDTRAATENTYVWVKDGHLFRDGERLRLWGVNIQTHHVRNRPGADATAARMREVGYNAVHLWAPRGTFNIAGQPWSDFAPEGHGPLDLFDYFIHALKQQGIFVTLPVLSIRSDMLTDEVYDLAPDDDLTRTEWMAMISGLAKRDVAKLKFVDPRIREAYFMQMRWLLNRTNPHTGRRYAEEDSIAFYQLEDEMGLWAWPPGWVTNRNDLFQRQIKPKWEAFLRERYDSTESLAAVWGELLVRNDGSGQTETLDDILAIAYGGNAVARRTADGVERAISPGSATAQTPEARWNDAWTFLYELAAAFYDDYLAELRAQASEGVGCNVVPVAVDSVIYTRAGVLFNTARSSSFLAGAAITQGGGVVREGVGYAAPDLQAPPYASHYSIEPSVLKVSSMPYGPLAGAMSANDPYRARVPLWRAIWASWQDWDAVYTYWWGYYRGADGPEDLQNLLNEPLYVTSSEIPGAWDVFNDEIVLASNKTASHVFRHFLIKPATDPTVFTFGRKTLFNARAADYYHAIWPELAATAYGRGAEIAFDPAGDYDLRMKGPMLDTLTSPMEWENGVEFDWEVGYTQVDTPHVKAFSGSPPAGGVTFSDGVSLADCNRPFVVFALVSADGRPITESSRLLYTLVSTSRNTGFEMDPTALEFRQQAGRQYPIASSMVVDPGGLPIVVDRVSATLSLPWAAVRHEQVDFLRQSIDREDTETIIRIDQSDPVFYGRLTRASSGDSINDHPVSLLKLVLGENEGMGMNAGKKGLK